MKRPLLGALAGAAALILLFGFSSWILSRNLGQARRASEGRMTGLAEYIADHLAEDIFSYPFEFTPSLFPPQYAEQQSRWLSRLTHATGLERAVITDSGGQVYASSENFIASGEDIRPYLVDTSLFQGSARDGRPRFTPLSEIDGVPFQSLYYPFSLRGKRQMLALESDQAFIASVEQFRTYLVVASIFVIILFAILTAVLYALERRFQAALAESRRNERLAFLGRTSAELAHELKNPLAIIKSSVDVLRKQVDPERKLPAFGYLSDEVMRLSRLIGNILGFSNEKPLEAKAFPPRAVLEEAATALGREFPEVAWTVSVPESLSLSGDADAFRQMAENLARNAAHAMGGKGGFTVSWEERGKGGAMRFADTGPGFPKAVRKHMFEPFVSGSKTGTGLGLSIVRSLCERSGWSLSLTSDRAQGDEPTCFEIGIPKKA